MSDQRRWGIAPYFIVDDVLTTATFYRDKLGFHYQRLWGEPPCFTIVQRNGAHIMLSQPESPVQMHPNSISDPEGSPWGTPTSGSTTPTPSTPSSSKKPSTSSAPSATRNTAAATSTSSTATATAYASARTSTARANSRPLCSPPKKLVILTLSLSKGKNPRISLLLLLVLVVHRIQNLPLQFTPTTP
jgi:hypothetical protein